MPQLDVNSYLTQIFWLFLCYAILFTFFSRYLVPRLEKLLFERDNLINGTNLRLERINAEANKFEAEYLSGLNHAYQDAAAKISTQKEQLEKELLLLKTNKESEIKASMDEFNRQLNKFRKEADKATLEMTVDIIENIIKTISGKTIDRASISDKILEKRIA